MTPLPDNLDQALRKLAAGDLDALSPTEMDRLEGLLNSRPDVAERVANRVARPDARMAAALVAGRSVAEPSAEAWQHAWERIDAAVAGSVQRTTSPARPRIWRVWGPLTAVAACIMIVGLWQADPATTSTQPWPMQLASGVQIDALEVYDDSTAFVVSLDGPGATDVIWILEDEG